MPIHGLLSGGDLKNAVDINFKDHFENRLPSAHGWDRQINIVAILILAFCTYPPPAVPAYTAQGPIPKRVPPNVYSNPTPAGQIFVPVATSGELNT
jgi:hypothetical protein